MSRLCALNPSVQKFLRRRVRQLQTYIEREERGNAEGHEALAILKYQLGTFLESLGDKIAAHCIFAEALSLLQPLVPLPTPHVPTRHRGQEAPPPPPQEQPHQQALGQKRDLFLSCVLRLELEQDMVVRRLARPAPALAPAPVTVERIPFGSLTYSQFLQRFALCSRPVIFTGAADHLLRGDFDWSLDGIAASSLGRCAVTPKTRVAESCEWAQHEDRPTCSLADFIIKMKAQAQAPARHTSDSGGGLAQMQGQEPAQQPLLEYLVDWSLAQHCPELLQGEAIRLPSLCAADWLQDTPPGSLYRDSWPSLFVGPAGSSSGLHIGTYNVHVHAIYTLPCSSLLPRCNFCMSVQ